MTARVHHAEGEQDPRNGNQDRVLDAIKQGVSEPRAIASWIGLELSAVRNAIKRLVFAGLVRRKNLGGYECASKNTKPLLGEAWK